MNQSTTIKTNKLFKKAIATLCVMFTILSLFSYLNIKPMQTQAASPTYSFSILGRTANGKTSVYYSHSGISSYKCISSWIHVTRSGRDSFSISVDANISNAYSYKSSRAGTVQFKNSSGKVIDTCTIRQDNPYIHLSKSEVSLGISSGRSNSLTFEYNCPFSIESIEAGEKKSSFGLYNNSNGKLTDGGTYQECGTVKSVNCFIKTTSASNYTGIDRKATLKIKFRENNKLVQNISVSQASGTPSVPLGDHFSCVQTDGGIIYVDSTANGSINLFDVSGFNVVIASLEKKNLYRKKLKFKFDSTPKRGYSSSGTIYGCIGESLSDDPDFYQAQLGTFTISEDGKTMYFMFKNASNSSTTYTYKSS